ncbi:MAG: translation initiation factor IF-3 [Myxococcales bacterium]
MAETHRINERIRFPQIRVIAADGEQLGIMSPEEARSIAYEQGLDLVEVAPDARPPVCKIMDYGRHKYDASKRKSASKSKEIKIKTIKLRPATDEHDLDFKLKNARAFLQEGNKVKFMMRLRGRENAVTERWVTKLVEVLAELNDVGVPIGRPQGEGRMIVMMYEPK